MIRGTWRQLEGWQARATRLLREAFPQDLADVPIYLMDGAQLPPEFDNPRAAAYTSGFLDLALQPYLPEWHSRGFAAVAFPDRVNETSLLGSILHECVHYHQYLVLGGLRGGFEVQAMCLSLDAMPTDMRAFAEQGAQFATERVVDATLPPWHAHELLFIWGAIHACYRAWQLGDFWYADQWINFAGPVYGLSSKAKYLAAAGDTPRELAGKSLLEVMLTDPPAALVSLWERDILKG